MASFSDLLSMAPQVKQVSRDVPIPDKALFLLQQNARFKALWGGRGSSKSWSIARALLVRAMQAKETILCAREFQNSIADSVHAVLKSQIAMLGLDSMFDVQEKYIRVPSTGSVFLFKGLHRNILEIKSTEGVTLCWVEEAQSVSAESWRILVPTVRGKPGSEIWVSYNPYMATDPTSVMFQVKPDERAIVRKIGWQDNPWFPEDLEGDRQAMLASDPDAYDHVWEGGFLELSEAAVFRGHYEVRPFEAPPNAQRFNGLDFGYSQDPNFATSSFIDDNCLYIEYEAYGIGVELDELPQFLEGGPRAEGKSGKPFPGIPDAKLWPIKADGSRPESISYIRRKGFNAKAAKKWPGSVEDGIAHLKAFKKIIIHPRCVHMIDEARLYRWKQDSRTKDILPILEDRNNHGWDSVRYSLDGYIMARGRSGVWAKLGQGSALQGA